MLQGALRRPRQDLEDLAMNELLTILPWAFGLVAAAAAVNLSR